MFLQTGSIDMIAIYAAIVATGALFLEIRRWVESGPKLKAQLISDAMMAGAGRSSEDRFFALTISNSGNLPTTITHLLLLDYGNFWNWLRKKPIWQGLVPTANVPEVLQPGCIWYGQVKIDNDQDLRDRRADGWLFVCVAASHSKRNFGRFATKGADE